jgi:hypothetical protein
MSVAPIKPISTAAADLGGPLSFDDLKPVINASARKGSIKFKPPAVQTVTPGQAYTVPGKRGSAPQNVRESSVTSGVGRGSIKTNLIDRVGGDNAGRSVSSVESFFPVASDGRNALGVKTTVSPTVVGVGAKWSYSYDKTGLKTNVEAQRLMPVSGAAAYNEYKLGLSTDISKSARLEAGATVVSGRGKSDSSEFSLGVSQTQGSTSKSAAVVYTQRATGGDSFGVRASVGDPDSVLLRARFDSNAYKSAGSGEKVGAIEVEWRL